MLFLVGSAFVLSQEDARSGLEQVFKNLVPIAADHFVVLCVATFFAAFTAWVLSKLHKKRKMRQANEVKKQGAYGSVPTHKHGILDQLLRPREVVAALQLLYKRRQDKKKKIARKVSHLPNELWMHLMNTSRSFASVIQMLPAPDVSDSVCVFYLVLRALDTVEDEMALEKFEPFRNDGESLLDTKVRLCAEFHKLFLDDKTKATYPLDLLLKSEIGFGVERDLLHSLPLLIDAFHVIKEKEVVYGITKEMGEGMSEYVKRDMHLGTTDQADYNHYCYIVAGLVGKGLTQLFGRLGYESPELEKDIDSWNSMGLFLQKTNITRDVCEDAAESRSWWPQDIWRKDGDQAGGSSLKELRDMSILNEMVNNALELLPKSLHYLDQLTNMEIYTFCAIPQIMALATLLECYNNEKVYTGVVKIRAGQAAYLMQCLMQGNNTTEQKLIFLREVKDMLHSLLEKANACGDTETIKTGEMCLEQTFKKIKSLERLTNKNALISTSSKQIAGNYMVLLGLLHLVKYSSAIQDKFWDVWQTNQLEPGIGYAFVAAGNGGLALGCIVFFVHLAA